MSLFVLVAAGIFNLSVIQGNKFKRLSNRNCIRLLPQLGARGKILDRNGEIIADNYLTYDVMVMPQKKEEVSGMIAGISRVLGSRPDQLKEKFRSGYQASFLPVIIEKNIDIKKAIAIEELKNESPGIIIQPHPLRRYPHGELACHVLGYLNEIDGKRLAKLADSGYNARDIVGFTGVEEKYDYFLRQQDGALSVEVDHRGKFMRVLGYRPPQSGNDLQLTLDLRVQKVVEEKMAGRTGSVIIMDPSSGEIIAMASSPGFKPSAFINKSGPYIARLFKDPDSPLINRSISGVYPPASVFKTVIASAGLDSGKINLNTTFFCPGHLKVGRRDFACWDTHNQQNLNQAIAHSCDVFFYRSGLLLGAQGIHDYALKFGLGKQTQVDLPYEVNGFVPSPLWKRMVRLQNWFDGDTANFSIGQGDLLVTPLQIARLISVFANGGFMVTPYIVKKIDGHNTSAGHKKEARIPIKDSVLANVNKGLRQVVADTEGTANILSGLTVSVAGKTGTAQAPRGQPHAWFAGYFPYNDPKYAICVFLEHGGSGYASCVLTKQIIEEMALEGLI